MEKLRSRVENGWCKNTQWVSNKAVMAGSTSPHQSLQWNPIPCALTMSDQHCQPEQGFMFPTQRKKRPTLPGRTLWSQDSQSAEDIPKCPETFLFVMTVCHPLHVVGKCCYTSPNAQDTPPIHTTKNSLEPKVNSAEVEKSCFNHNQLWVYSPENGQAETGYHVPSSYTRRT